MYFTISFQKIYTFVCLCLSDFKLLFDQMSVFSFKIPTRFRFEMDSDDELTNDVSCVQNISFRKRTLQKLQ